MSETDASNLDWVHLPPGVQPRSLWSCLHDAYVRSIRSDTLERSVHLEFETPHLQGWRGTPEDLRFCFLLSGVSSVRVATCVPWPGPAPDVTGKPYAEQNRLIHAYQAKWREESVNWREFEERLSTGISLEVLHAELAQNESSATLYLGGRLDYDEWHSLYLRAAQISASRSDGEPFSLDALIALGDDYWEAFSERSAQRQLEA